MAATPSNPEVDLRLSFVNFQIHGKPAVVFVTDALDVLHLFHGRERTVQLAVLDDALRRIAADIGKLLQFFGGRGIEVRPEINALIVDKVDHVLKRQIFDEGTTEDRAAEDNDGEQNEDGSFLFGEGKHKGKMSLLILLHFRESHEGEFQNSGLVYTAQPRL